MGRNEGRWGYLCGELHARIGSPFRGDGANRLTVLDLVTVELGLTCWFLPVVSKHGSNNRKKFPNVVEN